ncbi:MAG: hypothetical protein AMK75_00465 [Planctomycetes bacterium SM23_65]|nr:MAG: hypothetical protein AMK75_00465 [Planctomycetes bacterium SM23_65]
MHGFETRVAGGELMKVSRVLVVTALLISAASAQEKPTPAEPEPVKGKVIAVTEVGVDADGKIEVAQDQTRHVFGDVRPANFYIVVKVKREVPPKTTSSIKDLRVELSFGAAHPSRPYAVLLTKDELTEDGMAYKPSEKRRWEAELYYFPVTRGQREWGILVNGKAVERVLDHYATLVIRNVDGVSSRIKLPDGSVPVVDAYRQVQFQFPNGSYDLVLEVKGHGKVKLPWTKYGKGDFKYVAIASDMRSAPAIPAERLRKALAKIYFAWNKYHNKTGVGGGAYNIGSAVKPVHVYIDFGRGGTPGPPSRCEVDGIRVEYGQTTSSGRRGRGRVKPIILRYSERDNRYWKVEPWDKQESVYIPTDAREIVGQATVGKFVVRSVEKKPSTWSRDGLLSGGVLYDPDYGYLEAQVKKHGELVVVSATKTKEP